MSENLGVKITDLPYGRIITANTKNSHYTIEVLGGNRVSVTGGEYFPEAKQVTLIGSSCRPYGLMEGWVINGMNLELSYPGTERVVITSKIQSIDGAGLTDPLESGK